MMVYVKKVTSFSEAYPEYLSQWHPRNILRPETTASGSNKPVIWRCVVNPEHEWEASPNARFKSDGKITGCPYCSGRRVNTGVNDLSSKFPDIARQWSSQNKIEPSDVHAYSNKKFWWTGDCGHEWSAPVIGRTRQGNNCPYCSGHRTLAGFNDLKTHHPGLAAEWNDTRDITSVTSKSSYMASWRGITCGHVWKSTVIQRANGSGCPYCSGKRILKGFNDLASQRPDIADMWDASNSRKADEVTVGSGYVATWICAEGHLTKARVIEKLSSVSRCTVCEGTVTVKGITDFSSKHPQLAKQWVRGDKRPNEVRPMSSANATWKCDKGHEWEAPFNRRVNGHGCPFCAGQRSVEGVNDLASSFPHLVKEWHKDNDVDPSQVARSSSVPRKWVCSEGHTCTVSPNQRTSHKEGITGCPHCWSSGRSQMEQEMAEFIESKYTGKVIRHHRLQRLELDVFVPSLNIAFEFNGVHWHSEARGKGKHTHSRKLQVCRDNGIDLIQVWEDDWRDRRHVVEHFIAYRLRASKAPRIGARSLSVISISPPDARKFLNENHIQGFVSGSFYDALSLPSGEVVAVMVTTNVKQGVRLDRYATSTIVQGGFSKLLKVVKNRAILHGYHHIFTFSDNEISNGNLYRKNGFNVDRELGPDYKYVYNAVRVHKFLFRKKRFRKDPYLHYYPSMTELELASLNGISRVWDSGKIRWKLALPSSPCK